MQFKKHFSSNLQNLSVKKTFIVNPPPNIAQQDSFESESGRKGSCQSRRQSPHDSRCSSNKENIKYNEIFDQHAFNEPKNSRKALFENTNRISPMLTFNKIKQNTIQMQARQDQQNYQRKALQVVDNQPHAVRGLTLKNAKVHNESTKSIHAANNQQHGKRLRFGSMVFGSLVKRDAQAQREKSPIRQSRSFDRLSTLRTQRDDLGLIECMNNDGQQAKYKVVKHYQSQNPSFYCFNCAISLVKQNFVIEELSHQDLVAHKMKHSSLHRQSFSSRKSGPKRPLIQNDRIKIGEQVKCKIIMRLNKLKVSRQQFNKTIENNLESIDYFYHSLAAYIEQQRLNDRQEIIRIKNLRKNDPEKFQSQLSSSLGTIDYMIKNLQGVNFQFINEVEGLLESEVYYPKMKINVEPVEGFQRKINEFASFFQKNLKISLQDGDQQMRNRSRRTSQADQSLSMERSHPLRFSFEQALKQSTKRTLHGQMNPLQEENQSQLDQSLPIVERRQNAFRNLFPEQNEEYNEYYAQRTKQSPVFKQF